jgi:tRNA-splicing ligase RtcB (3'-phosphate/5'-hydroxy nucleic acid ligase)
MQLIDGIPVWGSPVDDGALAQIRNCARTADHVALMADHHKGYAVPIGGVVAYENSISPSGVGYDIACGNKAVLTDAIAPDIRGNIGAIMDDVWRVISFGVGRKNDERVDHELFDDPAWCIKAISPLKEMAQAQLGTVGSGNHYVDLFADEIDRVWIGVHFGSRGFGHKTATHFLRAAGSTSDAMDADPCVISADSEIGADYIACMNLAGRYAYAGRDWVCDRVRRILGANILEEVHNHHNFAWREMHSGRDFWVVRKGATPAFPGQRGFVGGTMGEQSVILEGVESDSGAQSLYSTVHGAGRVMGRMEAKGKYKNGVCVRAPKVNKDEMDQWLREAGVELRGAGLDEAPQCYKRLSDVLREHDGMVRVLHTLTPIGVAMAGANEFDPYKD